MMETSNFFARRSLTLALIILALVPCLSRPASATSLPPSPDPMKFGRDALIAANPVLAPFQAEVAALTPTLDTLDAFGAWFAARPADVLAFLQLLQVNPLWRQTVMDWVAAHPADAAALFLALATAPAARGD